MPHKGLNQLSKCDKSAEQPAIRKEATSFTAETVTLLMAVAKILESRITNLSYTQTRLVEHCTGSRLPESPDLGQAWAQALARVLNRYVYRILFLCSQGVNW